MFDESLIFGDVDSVYERDSRTHIKDLSYLELS